MSLTRRRFTQILASTLFLHHLPSFAQSVNFWASLTLPEAQNITRIVSAGAPADLLLLAVAPEKMVGFSSFDFARQALIPLPEHIRQLPRLGRLAGRASTLSLEGLMALHPDLVVDCGNTDETWISQARQVSEQTQIPWLLLNGKLEQSAEQLTTLGKTLGEEHRAAEQANLASRFVGEAQAFATSPAANCARSSRAGNGLTGFVAYRGGGIIRFAQRRANSRSPRPDTGFHGKSPALAAGYYSGSGGRYCRLYSS